MGEGRMAVIRLYRASAMPRSWLEGQGPGPWELPVSCGVNWDPSPEAQAGCVLGCAHGP